MCTHVIKEERKGRLAKVAQPVLHFVQHAKENASNQKIDLPSPRTSGQRRARVSGEVASYIFFFYI